MPSTSKNHDVTVDTPTLLKFNESESLSFFVSDKSDTTKSTTSVTSVTSNQNLRSGIDWSPACDGKTTVPAKEAWAACARAGGDVELAEEIMKEKNWRYNYIGYVIKVHEILAQPSNISVAAASAGLKALRDSFVFRGSNGKTCTLSELTETVPANLKNKFSSKIIYGEKKSNSSNSLSDVLQIPYKGEILTGQSEILEQLDKWVELGTCESDCKDKIEEVLEVMKEYRLDSLNSPNSNSLSPFQGKVIVILGAGSELGPLKSLLRWGATVIAVRTRKAKEWEKLEEFCRRESPIWGRLIIPQSRRSSAAAESESTLLESGADILSEPIEIRDWIIKTIEDLDNNVINESSKIKDITVGMYTYLDAEAHVRVSLGCDLIQEGIERYFSKGRGKKVRYAYLGSNSCPVAVGDEVLEAMELNRNSSPLWMRLTRCEPPKTSTIINDQGDHVNLFHGLSQFQGPNYVLAKSLQLWRAITVVGGGSSSHDNSKLLNSSDSEVSFNVAPAAKTESVIGGKNGQNTNSLLKYVMDALHLIQPNEAFEAETASVIMALLLAYDILVLGGKNADKVEYLYKKEFKSPIEITKTSCFHGGACRVGFNLEKSMIVKARLYSYGRWGL